MATLGEYLQTWKLKLSTTKTVSAVFHLNKEARRELKVNFNNETLPFCSEPKYVGLTLDRSLTYRRHLESLRMKLTSRVALLRRLAGSGWGAGATTLQTAALALVHSTAEYLTLPSTTPHWPHHQQRLANCDWMPASYTSGQPSNPCRHRTCWASSQWSHTIFRTPSIECCCTAPQIETPICTRRTATHQLLWQQQHTCGAVGGSSMECGVGGNPTRLRTFIPDTGTSPQEWPSQEEPGSGLTASALVSDVSALACTNGVWTPLRPVSVAQKNKPSTMSSSNVQSIDLLTDCTTWRFWTMRQRNGCSTPAPKSSAAKQRIKEELA